MKKFLLLLSCFCLSFAEELSLKSLEKRENSLAKDYYIYRLLEQDKISKKEAENLKPHIYRYAGRIQTALEKLIGVQNTVDKSLQACYNYTPFNITEANVTCQKLRLSSLTFISNLNPQTRQTLAYYYKGESLAALLLAFNDKEPLQSLIQNEDSDNFLKAYAFFNNPDIRLEKSFLDKLSSKKEFKSLAHNIIIKQENEELRKSLLNVNVNLSQDNFAFILGVNALKLKQENKALSFFKQAYHSFEKQEAKDNALFWIYMLEKNKQDLQTLANSTHLNIYSLYAKELLNMPLPAVISPQLKQKKVNFDTKDAFAWQALNKKIKNADEKELKKLANEFKSQSTLSIYTYILERIDQFKSNYFIMPYYEYIKDYNVQRQALILALARQESRFIPSAISTSYALGMMQFMPFLANHIAQNELKLNDFDQDDMFDPKTAYFFANHHLDYLEKYLSSPVFVSYAYNGGIGFTRRMLARDDLFKKGKYEPFLSMELVPYAESRLYAKKVLANYIVYLSLLNDNTKISSIFESLIQSTE